MLTKMAHLVAHSDYSGRLVTSECSCSVHPLEPLELRTGSGPIVGHCDLLGVLDGQLRHLGRGQALQEAGAHWGGSGWGYGMEGAGGSGL